MEVDVSVLEWITAALLVLMVGGIGTMKLVGHKDAIESAARLGYDRIMVPIGIAEVLAALGVLLGAAVTDLEWLGAAAAVGLIAMMIGAAAYHIRAGDRLTILPSIVVMVLAALYLTALNAT